MGSGADVVSGGELLKVIKSGIKPKNCFPGVGKQRRKLAGDKNILLINVESENEILINKIAGIKKDCCRY